MERHGYAVDEIDGDDTLIEELDKIIFICTDKTSHEDNRQIIRAMERKISKVCYKYFYRLSFINAFIAWCTT